MKKAFGTASFSEQDIEKTLKIKADLAHYLRFRLLQKKSIVRIARGVYKFSAGKPAFTVPPIIEYIKTELHKTGKPFVFTGLSLFSTHYPDANLFLLHVEKGKGEIFCKEIEKLKTSYIVLVNPKKEHIMLLMEKAGKKDFILIRENSYGTGAQQHIAAIECAFVDYYFEMSRGKLPLQDKTEVLLRYLLEHDCLNFSTLLKYAQLRGIRKEMGALLKRYSQYVPKGVLV